MSQSDPSQCLHSHRPDSPSTEGGLSSLHGSAGAQAGMAGFSGLGGGGSGDLYVGILKSAIVRLRREIGAYSGSGGRVAARGYHLSVQFLLWVSSMPDSCGR